MIDGNELYFKDKGTVWADAASAAFTVCKIRRDEQLPLVFSALAFILIFSK